MTDSIVIEPLSGFGLAAVLARKGVDAGEIAAALGLAPADGPRWSANAEHTLIGTGPGAWLVMREARGAGFPAPLCEALADRAFVADQSGAYAIWRIAGPAAETLLQRGVPVDLHPDAFPPGSVASTVIAHVGVLVWRLDSGFAIAVFRSYAGSFQHWLDLTMATL
jgi:heterotetrameric sarcosine oxidase gamma subunit